MDILFYIDVHVQDIVEHFIYFEDYSRIHTMNFNRTTALNYKAFTYCILKVW